MILDERQRYYDRLIKSPSDNHDDEMKEKLENIIQMWTYLTSLSKFNDDVSFLRLIFIQSSSTQEFLFALCTDINSLSLIITSLIQIDEIHRHQFVSVENYSSSSSMKREKKMSIEQGHMTLGKATIRERDREKDKGKHVIEFFFLLPPSFTHRGSLTLDSI